MFSNLSQNSILYILETRDTPKLLSGTINSITLPRPQYATFGLNMETVVDIVATIDGEKREFKRVPSNNTIANFGPEAFVLADSKDAMNSYVSAALLSSKNIVNSVDKHQTLIKEYSSILEELNPILKVNKEKDKAIQGLLELVEELKQMILTMTKVETTNTK